MMERGDLEAQSALPADFVMDTSLRPQTFDQFIGQNTLKENLAVYIEAARKRGEALDHCLFAGPPGLGKTTLAYLVAKTIGSELFTISGPALDKKGDLAAVLTNLKPNDVLFIDEIHRVPIAVEEVLYSAMEDFKLDIILGQGPGARTMRIDLPKFTLIGATTRSGLLSTPLRDRFGINFVMEFYQPKDIQSILMHSAVRLGTRLLETGAAELAHRSRGTPRIANRLLRRVRDFAEVHGTGVIDEAIAKAALQSLDVDHCGLDSMDKKILKTIIEKFDGGPVGIDSLAAAIGEEGQTLEDVYEPFLLQQGFIHRTPRGRIASRRSYEHFGLPFQNSVQAELQF